METNKNVKVFSKRYGMRAYEAYITYLIENEIMWIEEENDLTITVYI